LAGPWRPTGTPPLGEAWYGPFNGDPVRAQQAIKDAQEDIGGQITAAVEKIIGHSARQIGIDWLEEIRRPVYEPAIIQTQIDAPPPGYQRIMLSEIFRIAGIPVRNDFRDAPCYVNGSIPTNRAEVVALLRNMTVAVPPGGR
jgi:hypothetical protein